MVSVSVKRVTVSEGRPVRNPIEKRMARRAGTQWSIGVCLRRLIRGGTYVVVLTLRPATPVRQTHNYSHLPQYHLIVVPHFSIYLYTCVCACAKCVSIQPSTGTFISAGPRTIVSCRITKI